MVFLVAGFSMSATGNVQIDTQEDFAKMKKVVFKTTLGNITIALYDDTPIHRDNMIKLAKEGTYNGTLFHRVISEFMIQGGDVDSKNAKPGQQLGTGDLGYTLQHEIKFPTHYHKRGAVAAARTADQVNPEKRSSSAQFYIVTGKVFSKGQIANMVQQKAYRMQQSIVNELAAPHRKELMQYRMAKDTAAFEALQDKIISEAKRIYSKNPFEYSEEQIETYSTVGGTPHLDGDYTVYGEVIEGMDVVAKIEKVSTDYNDRPETDIKIIEVEVLE